MELTATLLIDLSKQVPLLWLGWFWKSWKDLQHVGNPVLVGSHGNPVWRWLWCDVCVFINPSLELPPAGRGREKKLCPAAGGEEGKLCGDGETDLLLG